ncbi:MAG: EAL domain-containing protein [Rhodoferax sp.]|nr:EAL domain-containing protein [Rhodoferax sp.]
MSTKENDSRPFVVGIGASAGGLEALSQLVSGLVSGLPCIYIVAQHMSPTHRSMMADILARETRLPVREIEDEQQPEFDVVYVIPPGSNLVMQYGRFSLTNTVPEVSPKPSINLLFQSLAEEYNDHAIGVILSGTGSDGTRGLRAIKSVGGVSFVQIPETAKYDGMPRSAIDACVADRIIAPDQIGRELERLIRFPGALPELESWEQRPAEMAALFENVRLRSKIDFSSYKLSTVQRRLQRRMVSTNMGTLAEYLAYSERNPEELDALAKETLISVTEFFRDQEAFRALERYARALLEKKRSGEELRIWVVGCATGEEAYSLAILFSELITANATPLRLQIFATDIDNDALQVARRGIYNQAAMSEMPAEFITRYFMPSGNGFEPVKSLRDCVTFARQDITADPPFLRLDLITCRNVLIYFNAELQTRVLGVFRYALREDGLLFLGRSESVNQQEALFAAVDRRSRIFRPRGSTQGIKVGNLIKGTLPTQATLPLQRNRNISFEQLFHKAIADHFAPSMLVNGDLRILHSHGDVSRFITFPSGTPDLNLAQLIVPELSNEILTTLHRARRRRSSTFSRKRRIAALDRQVCRLAVHPLKDTGDNEHFLVVFETSIAPSVAATDDITSREASDKEDSDELASTREHLQTLMEEMAASNEEMQALNEEIQAANEELQATNEELEASNEELQATNEELISVNEESLTKSAELATISSEFEGVYNTIDFPVLVFDTNLFLKRMNATAVRSFNLPINATGVNVLRLQLPGFLKNIEKPLAQSLQEQRKQSFPAFFVNRTYQIFITPVVGVTGNTQGVVLVVIDNSELVAAQEAIRASEQRLQSIMNHSVSIVVLKNATGRYEFVNHRFEEIFGIKAEDAIGKTDHQIFSTQVAKLLRDHDLETMRLLTPFETLDEMVIGERQFWLQSIRFPIYDNDGAVHSICTQANDVTQKRHAQEQLRLAAKVFDRAGEAITITDAQGMIITVNDAFTKITGYTLTEVIGKNPRILQSGKHSKDFYAQMWRGLTEHGSWQGEILNRRKNGDIYPEWLTINSVRNEEGHVTNYVAIFSDITAIKSSQRRIEFMATHDTLTGIPNRSLLLDRLQHALSLAKRKKEKIAVVFIDLDNFKTINDSLGHEIGDKLLKLAAERLQQCVRDSDTLARLGGDEFVAILIDVELTEVEAVAIRIVEYLSASFRINDQNLFVSASVGISLFPDDGIDSVSLLKNADTAMYRAKELGRNQYQFFSEDMKIVALQRLTHETAMRQGLDAGNFRMVYQPQIGLGSGKIIGAEALLRWRDPHLGEISPVVFIPVAEKAGLMNRLGEMVFNMVLAQISAWRKAELQVPRISINVSVEQFRDTEFAARVLAWAQSHDVPLSEIAIEITENVLAERIETVGIMLHQLEKHGATISIDDFGTGYSSLSYLKRLPIHELKVDRSFVDGLTDDAEDCAISKAIIDMAHALGMTVVAEGVETAGQRDVLIRLGCEVAQGYFYHRPLPVQEFAKLLTTMENAPT